MQCEPEVPPTLGSTGMYDSKAVHFSFTNEQWKWSTRLFYCAFKLTGMLPLAFEALGML